MINQATVQHLGSVLVDAQGKTLYSLTSEKGGVATCTGTCATVWPPVVLPEGTATAIAGPGVDAQKLSTAEAPDNVVYVSYAGWPLYTFSGDRKAGEDNGAGIKSFGGTWEPVRPSGALASHG